MPKIINMRDITPKGEMKKLRELAKTHGQLSPEYQVQLQKMTQQMLGTINAARAAQQGDK